MPIESTPAPTSAGSAIVSSVDRSTVSIGTSRILKSIAGYTMAQTTGAANRPPKLATVDSGYTSGWPRVTFDGETTMSTATYPCLESYQPTPGDRVLLTPIGTGYAIVGAISESGAGLTGSVEMFAGGDSAIPSGWLNCDGSAISRTTYARLFAAIGTTWGVGDGSSTFNLPDMRGRVPVGAGNGTGLTSRPLASSGGAEDHTLTESNLASHTHTGPSHTHSGPSHTHSIPSHTHGYATWQTQQSTTVSTGPNGYTMTSDSGTTNSGGSGTTGSGGTGSTGSGGTGATGSAGSGTAVDHMPPFAALIYIIKT